MKENSIEDIQKVEKLIKKCDECKLNECINCEVSWTEVTSIKKIIDEYKRVLGINEVLLKENEELKFKERSRIIGKYGEIEIHDLINKTLSKDYIPVQKVKDKMEKDIKTNEHIILGGRRNGKTLEYGKRLGRIEICRELLEGRK